MVWNMKQVQVFIYLCYWQVDGVLANYSGISVAFKDICLKPLDQDCATQSVLQVVASFLILHHWIMACAHRYSSLQLLHDQLFMSKINCLVQKIYTYYVVGI